MRQFCTREGKGCGDHHCSRNPGMTTCSFEYDEAKCPQEHRYQGQDWQPPSRWRSADGTVVYRSYSDYCD